MPELQLFPSLYQRYMAAILAEDRARAEREAVLAIVAQFPITRAA